MLLLIPFAFSELNEWGGQEKPATYPQIGARTLISMNRSQAGATHPRAAMCQVAFQSNHHKAFSPTVQPRPELTSCHSLCIQHTIFLQCAPALWKRCRWKWHAPCAQRIRITQHTVDCSQTSIHLGSSDVLPWWRVIEEPQCPLVVGNECSLKQKPVFMCVFIGFSSPMWTQTAWGNI